MQVKDFFRSKQFIICTLKIARLKNQGVNSYLKLSTRNVSGETTAISRSAVFYLNSLHSRSIWFQFLQQKLNIFNKLIQLARIDNLLSIYKRKEVILDCHSKDYMHFYYRRSGQPKSRWIRSASTVLFIVVHMTRFEMLKYKT